MFKEPIALDAADIIGIGGYATVLLMRALVRRGGLDQSDVRGITEGLRQSAGNDDAGMLQRRLAEFIEGDFQVPSPP